MPRIDRYKKKVKQSVWSLKRLVKYRSVRIILDLFQQFSKVDIFSMSASTSYYMLFALFPFVIFLTIIGAPIAAEYDFTSVNMDSVQAILPAGLNDVLDTIKDQVQHMSQTRVISLSIIVLLVACSKGFSTVIENLDIIYGRRRIKSNLLLSRLTGLLTTLLLGFLILTLLFVLTVGQLLLGWINVLLPPSIQFDSMFFSLFSNLISMVILALLFGGMLHVMSGRRGRLRIAMTSGLLMSLAWVLISVFFSRVMVFSERYTFLYGSFAGFMLFLLWIFLSMIIIYSGALVHSTYLRRKHVIQSEPALVTETLPIVDWLVADTDVRVEDGLASDRKHSRSHQKDEDNKERSHKKDQNDRPRLKGHAKKPGKKKRAPTRAAKMRVRETKTVKMKGTKQSPDQDQAVRPPHKS